LFLAISIFSSCDSEEQVPSYVFIPSIELETDATQGDNSQDIVDGWVYCDGILIGVFELPVRVPILESGEHTITVVPGIKKNGLFDQRITYPFYSPFEEKIQLVPTAIDTIRPIIRYRNNVTFSWLEDFEDNAISVEKSGSNTTTDSMFITNNPVHVFNYDGLENKYSGQVNIPSEFQIFENATVQLYELPRKGVDVFLEMNFKCNTEFTVGVYPVTGSFINGVPIVNFYSTEDNQGEMQWKKAYVSLKEDINNPEYNGATFRVFFNAQTNGEGEKQLFFDNLKLIHF
jgi:hypothetical protein